MKRSFLSLSSIVSFVYQKTIVDTTHGLDFVKGKKVIPTIYLIPDVPQTFIACAP
jgi:hypothetical protein